MSLVADHSMVLEALMEFLLVVMPPVRLLRVRSRMQKNFSHSSLV